MAMIRTDGERTAECIRVLLALSAEKNLVMTRTKVAKLLYLADMRSVEHDGVSGSGVAWRWRPYGPFADDLLRIEDDLVGRGIIDRRATRNWYGSREYRLQAVRSENHPTGGNDRFAGHLDAVLAEWGAYSASALKNITYKTGPMLEAQATGAREGLLDLGETERAPDIGPVLERFQAVLDGHAVEDDEVPLDNSRALETLEPLREARARATRALLD